MCSPDLERKNFADINPEIFPQSESDLEALVISAYYPLRGAYYVYENGFDQDLGEGGENISGIHGTSLRGLMYFLDLTTEILQSQNGDQNPIMEHNFNVNTLLATQFYDNFYNDISNMTLNIDLIENADVSEGFKNNAIAEIKCARGLLSYELFDMYGPIVVAPLEILKTPFVEAPLERLSNDEMVSFIEQDLLDAVEYLPLPSDPDAEYGRFTQGMARMILIRLYLHEKRWEDVIEQANEIIAMGHYSLEADYASLWSVNAPVNSNEVIWAIPCDYNGTSQNEWQVQVLPGNFPGRGGFATVQSSWQFYESFDATDIRRAGLITEYTTEDGVVHNRNNIGPNRIFEFGPIPLKIDLDADRTTGVSTVDIIVYRYADVLLSKAEAIANLADSGTQEAIDLINIVRTRAQINPVNLIDYTDIDAFNTMMLLERSHEYWCENGQYRADLIRHGKFKEYSDNLNGELSQSEPHNVLFPFSLARVAEGKGAFIQNPGY